jgi:hypothetical protein
VEHRHYAPQRTLPARFEIFFVMPLLAAAMSAECATVNRPVTTTSSETTQTSPPAITVRAQSGEPAPATVPPAPTSNPAADPAGVSPDAGASGDAGTSSSTSAVPNVTTGFLDTALESLFGPALTADWTPLSLSTLFTEGWTQPFVFSPASDGGALRQEWINAANGVFYRQWVLDYNFRNHAAPSGNRDIGTWSVFAPLSRRLELYISVPFTFDTNLTVGRFLTLDEVRYFKEFTVWVAASNSAAMDHSGPAADTMTILPGIRFRIARDTWFLYGVEIPLVAPRDEDFGMYFRLVRRW